MLKKILLVLSIYIIQSEANEYLAQKMIYLSDEEYLFKKKDHSLTPYEHLKPNLNQLTKKKKPNSKLKSSNCNGPNLNIGSEYDITWNKDDGSTPEIHLPFNFCFYGVFYDTVFMNNNGNISFEAPNSVYNPYIFPSDINKIIAGFWADFDFNNCGKMYSNVTNTSATFTWENVGYFDGQCDKFNTFQIIITDGNDPLVQNGNVALHYGDMNWTTGDASNGVNGYGGIPATIGANKGNNINYFQLGIFSQPGNIYEEGSNIPGGIDWLDNKSFYLDLCSSDGINIAPVALFQKTCTPYNLCSKGDTLELTYHFSTPENNQTTSIELVSSTLNNIKITKNETGKVAYITLQINGDNQMLGNHSFTIKATDNYSTPLSTYYTQYIDIFNGDSVIPQKPFLKYINSCPPVILTLSDSTFEKYEWSNGNKIFKDTIFNGFNSKLEIVASRNTCKVKVDTFIYIPQIPKIELLGNTTYCFRDSNTTLTLKNSTNFGKILWSFDDSLVISIKDTVFLNKSKYIVKVWDSLNVCSTIQNFEITQFDSLKLLKSNYSCDTLIKLIGNTGGSSYGYWQWKNNDINLSDINTLNPSISSKKKITEYIHFIDTFCKTNDSIKIIFADKPLFRLKFNDTICNNTTKKVVIEDSINMKSIQWDNDLDFQNYFSKNLTPGDHYLKIQNKYTCQNDTNFKINSFKSPELIHSNIICGDSIIFNKNIGYTKGSWEIFTSDGEIEFPTFQTNTINTKIKVSNPGKYTFAYTDERCYEKDTLTINFYPLPAGKIDSVTFCDGFNRMLKFTPTFNNYKYDLLWSTNDTNLQILANNSQEYSLTTQNTCGKLIYKINLDNNNCEIKIPNVFTPNMDDENDIYFISDIGNNYSIFLFSIFNRWGNEIINFTNPNFTWNGRLFDNSMVQNGTYFYKLIADDNIRFGTINVFH